MRPRKTGKRRGKFEMPRLMRSREDSECQRARCEWAGNTREFQNACPIRGAGVRVSASTPYIGRKGKTPWAKTCNIQGEEWKFGRLWSLWAGKLCWSKDALYTVYTFPTRSKGRIILSLLFSPYCIRLVPDKKLHRLGNFEGPHLCGSGTTWW